MCGRWRKAGSTVQSLLSKTRCSGDVVSHAEKTEVLDEERNQSVSQLLFHGPAPRSPLHRLAVRLRHSRSNTNTEYSLPGATQLNAIDVNGLRLMIKT